MNQLVQRIKLGLCLLGAVIVSLFMPGATLAGSTSDLRIEYGEIKVAFDSIIGERDQLKAALFEAQNTIASMRSRLNAVDDESAIFKNQASQMKLRIGALGIANSGETASRIEQRLLCAVSDLRIATGDKKNLAAALVRMTDSASAYASVATTADPRSRLALEYEIRNANVVLGVSSNSSLQDESEPTIGDDATVISVKDDLSLVVMNLGSRQGLKAGMPFKVMRSDKLIGTVRVVDVREKISGAVVQSLSSESNRIKFGDHLRVDAMQ